MPVTASTVERAGRLRWTNPAGAGGAASAAGTRRLCGIVFIALVCFVVVGCRDRAGRDEKPPMCRDADPGYVESDDRASPQDYVTTFSGRGVEAASDPGPLPLLIAIHGLGDRPESFCEFMKTGISTRARIVCPRAPNVHGGGYSWFPPMRTLTTPERLTAALEDAGGRVAVLTSKLACDPNVLGKPVLTGYSQGGMTSYYLAVENADRYSAVVPIAGLLPAPLRERVSKDSATALYGFHGKADELVPYAEAQRTAAAFSERWPQVEFEAYDGVGHPLSAEMRRDIFRRLDTLLANGAP